MSDRTWVCSISPAKNFIIVQDVGGWGMLTDVWVFSVQGAALGSDPELEYTTYRHDNHLTWTTQKVAAQESAVKFLQEMRDNPKPWD